MGIRIGIGRIVIGGTGGGFKDPSSYSDIQFWGKGRSGLTIPDVYGNDAKILPSCALVDENNYLKRTEGDFASTITDGYVEIRCYYPGSGNYIILFSSSDALTNTQQFILQIMSGKPVIQVIGTSINNVYKTDDVISTGWHILKFVSTGSNYQIYVDGDLVSGSATTGTDDGKWIGDVTLRDNIYVGYVKRLNVFAGALTYIDYIDFNNINKWYFSGVGSYEYDILGGWNFSWEGSAHVYYGNTIGNQFLDVGYDFYTKENGINEYIPYVSAGTPSNTPYCMPAWMQSIGYIFWGHIPGDPANYNLAPALIEFPNSIVNYDRSNVTIHKAVARAGADYNSAKPFRWRGRDVANPDIYYAWKNTGYEAKQFAKIDFILANPVKVYEFISYSINKNATQKALLENYCNIKDYYDVDVILMGDKTGGEDIAISQAVNIVFEAQNPNLIIGTGDYDGDPATMAQLLTNLTTLKFSCPGNHDDWVVGVRTEFNANFQGAQAVSGGGYKRIKIPNADIFLYDFYLKMDQSGYNTLWEAYDVTPAARQASAQGQWLINGLAASTAKWKIVVFHNPAWASPSDYPGNPLDLPLATNMQWDWYALGADLILNGHYHFYERLLKNTGSGNVPIIICGTAGNTTDLGRLSAEPDSLAFFNDVVDADFVGAHLIQMNVTRNKLQIDVSGIDVSYNIHAGKDQLILT